MIRGLDFSGGTTSSRELMAERAKDEVAGYEFDEEGNVVNRPGEITLAEMEADPGTDVVVAGERVTRAEAVESLENGRPLSQARATDRPELNGQTTYKDADGKEHLADILEKKESSKQKEFEKPEEPVIVDIKTEARQVMEDTPELAELTPVAAARVRGYIKKVNQAIREGRSDEDEYKNAIKSLERLGLRRQGVFFEEPDAWKEPAPVESVAPVETVVEAWPGDIAIVEQLNQRDGVTRDSQAYIRARERLESAGRKFGADGRLIDGESIPEVEPVRAAEPARPEGAVREPLTRTQEALAARDSQFWVRTLGVYGGRGEPAVEPPAETRRPIGDLLRANGYVTNEMSVEQVWQRAQEIYFRNLLGDRLLQARQDMVLAFQNGIRGDGMEMMAQQLGDGIDARLQELNILSDDLNPMIRARFVERLQGWVMEGIRPERPGEAVEPPVVVPADTRSMSRRELDTILKKRRLKSDNQSLAREIGNWMNRYGNVDDDNRATDEELELADTALAKSKERKRDELTIDQVRTGFLEEVETVMKGSTVGGEPNFANMGDITRIAEKYIGKLPVEVQQKVRSELIAMGRALDALKAINDLRGETAAVDKLAGKTVDQKLDRATSFFRESLDRGTIAALVDVEDSDSCVRANVTMLWMELSLMDERAANTEMDDSRLNEVEKQLRAGKIKGADMQQWKYDYVKALLHDRTPPVEVTDLELRKAEFLHQIFTAVKNDKTHPLHLLVDTRNTANTRNEKKLFTGSKWVFRDAAVRGTLTIGKMPNGLWNLDRAQTKAAGGENTLPVAIMKDPAELVDGLALAVKDGRGVDTLIGVLSKPMVTGQEDEITKLRKIETDAAVVQVRLAEVAIDADEKKAWSPDMLWKIREKVMSLVTSGQLSPEDALDGLEKVTRVYFLESSIIDDGAKDANLKPSDKLKNPIDMWQEFLGIAAKRKDKEKVGGVDSEVVHGFFELQAAVKERLEALGKLPVSDVTNREILRLRDFEARNDSISRGKFQELRSFVINLSKEYTHDTQYKTFGLTIEQQGIIEDLINTKFPDAYVDDAQAVMMDYYNSRRGVVGAVGRKLDDVGQRYDVIRDRNADRTADVIRRMPIPDFIKKHLI